MMWYKLKNTQVELKIFVKPNAKRTRLIEINQEQGMVIALHAKPQEGEANRELIQFLAKLLQLPKNLLVLQHGTRSRHKKVCAPFNAIIKNLINDPLKFSMTNEKK